MVSLHYFNKEHPSIHLQYTPFFLYEGRATGSPGAFASYSRVKAGLVKTIQVDMHHLYQHSLLQSDRRNPSETK